MTEMPTISVTELVTAFKEIIETALPPVCVEAEISNCKRSAAGHYYLTLKDDNSEIGAVIWEGNGRAIEVPAEGRTTSSGHRCAAGLRRPRILSVHH